MWPMNGDGDDDVCYGIIKKSWEKLWWLRLGWWWWWWWWGWRWWWQWWWWWWHKLRNAGVRFSQKSETGSAWLLATSLLLAFSSSSSSSFSSSSSSSLQSFSSLLSSSSPLSSSSSSVSSLKRSSAEASVCQRWRLRDGKNLEQKQLPHNIMATHYDTYDTLIILILYMESIISIENTYTREYIENRAEGAPTYQYSNT